MSAAKAKQKLIVGTESDFEGKPFLEYYNAVLPAHGVVSYYSKADRDQSFAWKIVRLNGEIQADCLVLFLISPSLDPRGIRGSR